MKKAETEDFMPGTKITLPVRYRLLSPKQKKKVRETYIERQKYKCYFCKNPLDNEPTENVLSLNFNEQMFPPGFLNNPIHLHHSHADGMTIGAVHARCNAYLFQIHGE